MEESELLVAAKKYLKLGFSFFPVKLWWDEKEGKFQKTPTVKWKEYQERKPTLEEIEEWFGKGSTHNGIGIVTGSISKLHVVDVDSNIDKNVDELSLKSSRVATTPFKGGKHYYYKIDQVQRLDITTPVKIGGREVDARGDGGFVVAPPSSVERDGKVYRYTWDRGAEIETMFLPTLGNNKQFMKEYGQKKKIDPDGWTETEFNKLDIKEHVAVEQGSRDERLFKLACSLVRKHSEQEAWLLLWAVNQSYSPPLDKSVVVTKFRQALKYASQDEKPQDETVDSFLVGAPVAWSKVEAHKLEEQWIWDNYIAKGNITLLTAIMKSGKSTFLRCLLTSLNKEEEFAGQPTHKSKVLVISEESNDKWVEAREELEDDLDHVMIWVRPTRGKPNHKKWEEVVTKISERCVEDQIDLVVIDTLSSFWPIDDENNSAQVVKALLPLYRFTEENIGVLLVHHDRKGGGNYGEASRGSNALTAFVDNIVHFVRNPDGVPSQRILRTWGRFTGVVENVVVEYTKEGKYEVRGNPWEVSYKARKNKVAEIIKNSDEELSAKMIHQVWITTIGDISRRTIQNILKDLLGEGLIVLSSEKNVDKRKTPYYRSKGWIEK